MQEQTEIRVFIADDHEVTLRNLSEIINAAPGMRVVDTVMDATAVEPYFRNGSNGIDIILMDIGMPEIDGLSLMLRIKNMCKGSLKVIMITGLRGVIFPSEALRNHADGFIAKSRHKDEIVDAIRRVHKGEMVILPDTDEEFPVEDFQGQIPDLTNLSDKTIRVICMVAKGFIIKEIADTLDISENYAERIKNIAMHKLGAKNSAHLGAIVEKYGLCRVSE